MLDKIINALSTYCRLQSFQMFVLGMAAGLPYLLIFSSLALWLRDYGLSLTAIGFFGLAPLAFSLKFVWAPFLDAFDVPILGGFFGRRKSWLMVTQLALIILLFGIAVVGTNHLSSLVFLIVLLAFSSATQDICIDAWRIESAGKSTQAILASVYIVGYRIGMLLASGLLLNLVDYWRGSHEIFTAWSWGYALMGGLMLLMSVNTLFLPNARAANKKHSVRSFSSLLRLLVSPIGDFFRRYGRFSVYLLTLILVLRISDILMGTISSVFYKDIGFSLSDIANYSRTYGLLVTLIGGGILGGILVKVFGIYRVLLLSTILAAISNLMFIWLAQIGPQGWAFFAVITVDNLSSGIANLAAIAFLSSLVNRSFSTSQYAVFSSIITIVPKFLSALSGWLVDAIGYNLFFIFTTFSGLPALFLIIWLRGILGKNSVF